MELGLRGKTVIVTGGASNIGYAISLAFAREGSEVVIADYDEPQARKVAEQITTEGGRAAAMPTDVSDWDEVQAMVEETLKRFNKIDVLVNNAAWGVVRGTFMEQAREDWEKSIDATYWGTINCTRAVLPHMIERRYGKIINNGSDAGRVGEFGESVFSGVKGAVIALTKSIAKEVGRYGICVNVVCPALTIGRPEISGEKSMWAGDAAAFFTPEIQEKAAKRYPLSRLAKPEDIAPVIVFLGSDCASYITGQTWSVDGGYTML